MIRVAVDLVGGSPLESGDRSPTVVLAGEPGWPRMVAEKIGSEQIIRGISFENGTWEVSVYTRSRSEVYTAPFHLQRGRRDQKFTLRLLRDTVKPASQYHSEGRMEVSLSTAPTTTLAREFNVEGRVVGPVGSPVEVRPDDGEASIGQNRCHCCRSARSISSQDIIFTMLEFNFRPCAEIPQASSPDAAEIRSSCATGWRNRMRPRCQLSSHLFS